MPSCGEIIGPQVAALLVANLEISRNPSFDQSCGILESRRLEQQVLRRDAARSCGVDCCRPALLQRVEENTMYEPSGDHTVELSTAWSVVVRSPAAANEIPQPDVGVVLDRACDGELLIVRRKLGIQETG